MGPLFPGDKRINESRPFLSAKFGIASWCMREWYFILPCSPCKSRNLVNQESDDLKLVVQLPWVCVTRKVYQIIGHKLDTGLSQACFSHYKKQRVN